MTSPDNDLEPQIGYRSWWRDRNIAAAAAAGLLVLLASKTESAGAGNLAAGSLFLLAIVAGACVFARAAVADYITQRRICIDHLVMIATAVAVAAGDLEGAAMLAFFYALAKTLYLRLLAHAASTLRVFAEALPKTATVLREGRATHIPATQLVVRDIVIVAPDARLPTDGRITSGVPLIGRSPVLGAGTQFPARRGDVVLAGSTNLNTELTLRATRAASDSALAHVIALLGRALGSEGVRQSEVEAGCLGAYGGLVLVAALAIAIVTSFSTDASSSFARASAFIGIAASWALVASQNAPMIPAFAAAAHLGVFTKGGRTLQQLAAMRAVAISASALMDAEADVTNIDISAADIDTRSIFALAADVAHASGRADLRPITSFARSMGIAPRLVQGTRALEGGAAAWTQAGWVYIVRPDAVEVANRLEPRSREAIRRLQAQGRSVFVMGSDREVWGFIATRERLRADAIPLVRELRAHGVQRIVMLGVDDARTVQGIAEEAGIDEICNRCDKAVKVRELMACYGNVAVIGTDDADDPALAAASLRIRVGTADVARAVREVDVLQLREDLAPFGQTLRLVRRSKSVIRQNLAFSLLTQAILLVGVMQAQWTLALVALVNFLAVMVVLGNTYRFHRSAHKPAG